MSTKLLLVDLDKDYIKRVESGSEFKLDHDLFQEAVNNLKQDIKYWTDTSGITLELETTAETVETVLKYQEREVPLTKVHSRVYAKLASEDDLAWINLSIGNIKPAKRLAHGQTRGWQFDWGRS